MAQTIQQRINYIKQELATRDKQEGWLIEGLRRELERLEKKNAK